MDKKRFKKLYQLAHGGDVVAKADLWLEFGFAYDHDPIPAFMQESPSVADPGSGGTPVSVTNPSAPPSYPLVPSRGQKKPPLLEGEVPSEPCPSSDLSRLSSDSSVSSVVTRSEAVAKQRQRSGKNKTSAPKQELPCK